MRLIDADVLVERCKRMASIDWNSNVAPPSWAHAYKSFLFELEDEPTIEAEPVRHGEWISFDDVLSFSVIIACSVCGSSGEIPKSLLLDKFSVKFNNYCPNCGAKMVEPQESEEEDAT